MQGTGRDLFVVLSYGSHLIAGERRDFAVDPFVRGWAPPNLLTLNHDLVIIQFDRCNARCTCSMPMANEVRLFSDSLPQRVKLFEKPSSVCL